MAAKTQFVPDSAAAHVQHFKHALLEGLVVLLAAFQQDDALLQLLNGHQQASDYAISCRCAGGDIGAKNATLSIMIGGEKSVVEALQPLFAAMGKTIVHQGGPGAGQHTKMANQILIATNMIGVCESLLYGYKAGLDLPTMLQSVGPGAAGSWSLNNLGPRIMANNFDPGFFVEHFIKDMGIALSEARRMGLCLPGLALGEQLYLSVKAKGWGRNGTHALMLALAEMANIDWRNRK